MEADFASVWSRVTGTNPAEDELTMLRRWIRDETETMRSYEGLLRSRLPNTAAETLRCIKLAEAKDAQADGLYRLTERLL